MSSTWIHHVYGMYVYGFLKRSDLLPLELELAVSSFMWVVRPKLSPLEV